MLEWTKSVRAISVIIIILGMTAGLFVGKIPVDLYSQAAMLVIGAYFAKRDTESDRGNDVNKTVDS